MRPLFWRGAICAGLISCGAPDGADNRIDREDLIASTSAALTTSNGTTFNGISYGGWSLRYAYSRSYAPSAFVTPLYGTARTVSGSLDRVSGLSPNGTSTYDAEAVRLNGAQLADGNGDGVVDAQDLAGAALQGAMDSGQELVLKIEEVAVGADGRFRFALSAGDELAGERAPLCGLDPSGRPRKAIAVPGIWNTEAGVADGGDWSSSDGSFSFACEGSSIEKCVRLGYGPEELDFFGRPHRLLACVRMLRADYCGDGSTWTTDGRLIEVWDGEGINTRTEPDWPREGAWTPEGAMCLDNPRLLFPEESATPLCLARLKYLPCSSLTPASVWSSFFRFADEGEADENEGIEDEGGEDDAPAASDSEKKKKKKDKKDKKKKNKKEKKKKKKDRDVDDDD